MTDDTRKVWIKLHCWAPSPSLWEDTEHFSFLVSTWENTKYLLKQEKKKNFFPSFYNPVPIKGFLEKGIAGQWLSCFHMAVIITVSLVFFSRKDYNYFSIYFPPWYGFIIILNGFIIFHLDGPRVAYTNKHWASVHTCWAIFQIVPWGWKR